MQECGVSNFLSMEVVTDWHRPVQQLRAAYCIKLPYPIPPFVNSRYLS